MKNVAILTSIMTSGACGVADYSLNFSNELTKNGCVVTIFANEGDQSKDVEILPNFFEDHWFNLLKIRLQELNVDTIIMQYTPHMYVGRDFIARFKLLRKWSRLIGSRTSVIVFHETYFWTWRSPLTLFFGVLEKVFMKQFARATEHVFSASEPLINIMSNWNLQNNPKLMPIGSNLPLVDSKNEELRKRYGLSAQTFILTIFGGSQNVKRLANHVNTIEIELVSKDVDHTWLFLGDVSSNWFNISSKIIAPGFLAAEDLSSHLQITDICIAPHLSGLCAKRGTIMAALQHGLPIIGTEGEYTDDFWNDVEGVELSALNDKKGFAIACYNLVGDKSRRQRAKVSNQMLYQEKFDWPSIAKIFIDTVGNDNKNPGSTSYRNHS